MLEGEIADEEQKIQSSLMHLKGRAPGKGMAPLNETKTVKKTGIEKIKIQFGVCQIGLGVAHSRGDVVKLGMLNWMGEV